MGSPFPSAVSFGTFLVFQETEKAMERVAKARESSELWREVRELRRDRSDGDSQPRRCALFPLGSKMISLMWHSGRKQLDTIGSYGR
jgi:hypothetical protein